MQKGNRIPSFLPQLFEIQFCSYIVHLEHHLFHPFLNLWPQAQVSHQHQKNSDVLVEIKQQNVRYI